MIQTSSDGLVELHINPVSGLISQSGATFVLHINFVSGLILQEVSGDGPKVTLVAAVSNSENTKEWTLGLSGQGSVELAIAFDVPVGTQATELHWPELRPFSLEQ